MSVHGLIDKGYVIQHAHVCAETQTHSGILYSHEKEEVLPFVCDNMDGPWMHYAKWDKSDQEREILYNITYMWNLKKPNL